MFYLAIVKNSLYHWKQWINTHANAAGFSIKASDVPKLYEYANRELANINFDAKGKVQIDAATLNVYLKSYLLPTTRILAYKPDTINIAYEKLAKKNRS